MLLLIYIRALNLLFYFVAINTLDSTEICILKLFANILGIAPKLNVHIRYVYHLWQVQLPPSSADQGNRNSPVCVSICQHSHGLTIWQSDVDAPVGHVHGFHAHVSPQDHSICMLAFIQNAKLLSGVQCGRSITAWALSFLCPPVLMHSGLLCVAFRLSVHLWLENNSLDKKSLDKN